MITNILKRIANIIVTVPPLALVAVGSIFLLNLVGPIIKVHARAINPSSIDMSIELFGTIMLGALCSLALVSAVMCFVVIFYGYGFPFRKVEEFDSLQNPDGSTFRTFDRTEFIWFRDPMFKGRKLMEPNYF